MAFDPKKEPLPLRPHAIRSGICANCGSRVPPELSRSLTCDYDAPESVAYRRNTANDGIGRAIGRSR